MLQLIRRVLAIAALSTPLRKAILARLIETKRLTTCSKLVEFIFIF